ncbi:ABC transporter ATP-binding protein [Morganella morganii]|uniref:ABC transporter ATP-binding protein n=1 Tax=Morganella morganii TaxID=582 RepID=UPI00298E2CF6|nr:ABC transporter ATP-binding protein [Morganella morganii]MDW7793551.1 ABC transporter ATP-binding protein [Morganella morganii]
MDSISVKNVGKAYKIYPNRFSRLHEWISPIKRVRHNLKWILKDISFNVGKGETVGIIGVNGAGKSTLLKLITGTTQPTEGSIAIHGRVAAMLELGMGFHPDFTGRQNVFMACQLQGLSIEQIHELMPEIEAFAEIGEAIDQPLRIYSSGMQVRLAFSVATAVRPDVLIVDEALSVGDMAFQAKCFQRINRYRREGMTLLFVTHALDDIVKHCQKAILLRHGTIDMIGEPRDVVNRFRDQIFGKSKKIIKVKDSKSPEVQLSTEDVYHTRPLYQKIEYRWGGGGAKIIDYAIIVDEKMYPTAISTGSNVNIVFNVLFEREIIHPVFGIMIKTHDGVIMYGTNSEISSDKDVVSGQFNSRQVVKCSFLFPMNLNRGNYLISLGVSEFSIDGEDKPLDRRYDSIMLQIVNEQASIGLTNLNAKFDWEQ